MSRLSVIVAVRNRREMLMRALRSLDVLGDLEREVLVVDGFSEDGSAEVACQSGATVLQSAASGVYAAWNLALAEIPEGGCLFLNSDDELLPDMSAAVRAAMQFPLDIWAGSAQLSAGPQRSRVVQWAPPKSVVDAARGDFPINAFVFQRRALLDAGGFDVRLRLLADRKLVFDMLRQGATFALKPNLVTYRYHGHEESQTLAGQRLDVGKDLRLWAKSLPPRDRMVLTALSTYSDARIALARIC